MLGVLMAVERSLARPELEFTRDPMTLAWRASDRATRGGGPRAVVLCFGDSLVKLGVQPRVLEADLGRSAYNLAIPGATAPAGSFLLRRILASGARPRAVVVDFDSSMLTSPPRETLEYWPELVGPRELLDLCWNAHDPRLFGCVGLARLLPSVRFRRAIRDGVQAAIEGRACTQPDTLLAHLRNWRVNGGATAATPRAGPPIVSERPGAAIVRGSWQPYPANAAYVRRFLDLAAAHRLPVFWLLPPLSPARQAQLEQSGQDEGYVRFVRSLMGRYPNVVVIDGRRSGYGREVFIDATHLDRRGAAAYSTALATLIGPRLDGPGPGARWLRLPLYRDRPGLNPLEDVEQSRVALRAGATRR
jgi:hypothetical protein